MKKTRMDKGITLIALIITIIILLILAVVTINAIKNGGIIDYARQGKDDYVKSQEDEEQDLDNLEKEINKVVNGWVDNGDGTFSKGNVTVKLGDYINYTYDTISDGYLIEKAYSGYTKDQSVKQTTSSIAWRVIGVNDEGELELICTSTIDSGFTLSGATGYNNGVFLLNDICEKLYSNTDLGIKARNLTLEDIEKGLNDKIGNKKLLEIESGYYPTLYADEIGSGVSGQIREGGIGQSDSFYTKKEDLSKAYDDSGIKISTSYTKANGTLIVTPSYDIGFYNVSSCRNEVYYSIFTGLRRSVSDTYGQK